MTEKTAIEFLFFSYFGTDFDNCDDIVTIAINRAYKDAASHVLKFTNLELSEKDKEKRRMNARKEATKEIRNALNESNKGSRDWYKEIISKLLAVYAGREMTFSGGIAQKWINMTIKNIYIIKQMFDKYNKQVQSLNDAYSGFENYDIPIDDFIIKIACDNGIDVPCKSGNKDVEFDDNYDNKLAWSNWNIKTNEEECYYSKFQKEFYDKFKSNKDEDMFDVENKLWMREAIRRKVSNVQEG